MDLLQQFYHAIIVVTKTWNDPQRPTTTHYVPQRPTPTPQRRTTIHNDPQRPTTTHNDPQRPTTTPQRATTTKNSHNDPQVHNNPTTISACASGSFAFLANFDHMC